ncbi:MAG: hypothetical protein ACRDH7_01220 [Actinomycetota bacterium]
MKLIRPLLFLVLVSGGLLVVAAPALAGSFDANNPLGPDAFVVLTGRLDMPRGLIASDAIIFNGDATIRGDVTNNVIAFNGDVLIAGNVGKNVMALNGTVTVVDGAHVRGDVVSRLRPSVAPGTVDGQIRQSSNFNVNLGQITAVGRILVWLASSVSSFLLGLLLVLAVPKAMDTAARTATERFGASIGFGFLMFVGLPIAAVVAMVLLLGIPLGLGILLALGLLYWLGYTAGAYALGRRLVAAPTHRLVAFLAGWAILRAIALIPIVAGLVWLCVTVWGLGALVIAARTAGRAQPEAASVDTPSIGAPPIPPPPPIPVS